MDKIKGFFQIIRPLNCLITFISIFIGGLVTGSIQPVLKLLSASVSGMIICAGANTINDYFDIDIDRINKPARPLPAEKISPSEAFIYSMILFICGFLLSFLINYSAVLIAAVTSILLYFYSRNLKKTILWGNLTVAFLSGLAFVYGGIAVGRTLTACIVGIFAFLFHFAREIIKDIEDKKGDESEGIKTFPIRYGIKPGLILAASIMIILILLTYVPYILNIFSIYYLIAVTAGTNIFLVYVIISMWKNQGTQNMHRLAVLMKADMIMSLLAVYLGG